MATYVYLGYGTTDSNGIAKLDHDANGDAISHSYTGTGAGEIDVIGSTDAPADIGDGSLQSEIYEVLDAIFYDDGLVNPNSNWDCNIVTRSVESNGTKFLVTSNNATARASMNPLDNSSALDFDGVPMAWEFDFVDYSASGVLQAQFYQTTPTSLNKVFSLKNDNYIGKTIKIIYTGTKLELYVDGVHTGSDVTVTYDTSNKIRVGFTFSQANDYCIVKNVKAYPI